MTIWLPSIDETGPVYLAITRALEADIASGRLNRGDQLPTHRELATHLGVNVGTVSRAYAEARRRGLLQGEVGRGTFVRVPSPSLLSTSAAPSQLDDETIDLSVNLPPPQPTVDLAAALQELAARPDASTSLGYGEPRGSVALRQAAASWLGRLGHETSPDQLVVCAGAQHAILVALACVAGPGETVACEALTYPGFLGAARTLGLRVLPVASDAWGVLPEALEALCLAERPRALYCMPALQNPTAAVMTRARREQIAALARRFDLAVVCDDIQTGVVEDPFPPISTWAPAHTLSIISLSKVLAPGLRVAFLFGGRLDTHRAHEAIWSTVWMASPIMAALAEHFIESGRLDGHLEALREELATRHAVAADALASLPYVTRPLAQYLWLPLPSPWSGSRFAAAAAHRGVRVSPAEVFCAERGWEPPAAVRLSISAPPSHADLSQALKVVAALFRDAATSTASRCGHKHGAGSLTTQQP